MNLRYALITLITTILVSCSAESTSDEAELFEQEVTATDVTVTLTEQEEELFDLINEHRVSIGLDALEFSHIAHKFAVEHNDYMIAQGELSHKNFSARASKIAKETKANLVAENVARNYILSDKALQGWLDSHEHKKTLEGDFTHATLSIKKDKEGNPYYTNIFFKK